MGQKSNQIVIVERDDDDRLFLVNAFKDMDCPCDFRQFNSAVPALDFLKSSSEKPLMIISDIDLPKMNGLQFKNAINNDPELRNKKIPFMFLSSEPEYLNIRQALGNSSHCYFQKPDNITDLDLVARAMMKYLQ